MHRLSEPQRRTLVRAAKLKRDGMLICPEGSIQFQMYRRMVATGLLVEAGEALHEETGEMRQAFAITDAGEVAIAPPPPTDALRFDVGAA